MNKFLTILFILVVSLSTSRGTEKKKDTVILEKHKIAPKTKEIKPPEKKEEKLPLERIHPYTKTVASRKIGREEISLKKSPLAPVKLPPPAELKKLPKELTEKIIKEKKEVEIKEEKPPKITKVEKRKLVEKEEVPTIVKIEKDKVERKIASISALGELRPKSVLPILKEEIKGEIPEVKIKAAELLARLGEPIGRKELEIAARKKTPERIEAIRALGRVGEKSSIPVLKELLPEPTINLEVAISLAKLGDKTGIEFLRKMVYSEDKDKALESAIALAEVNDTTGIKELKRNINHRKASVRQRVINALSKIGDKSIIPLLEKVIKEDKDAKVRVAASEAILKIKEKKK